MPTIKGDRALITRCFIHLIGLVHLFNFYSLAVQVNRCVGEDGLLPAKEYVQSLWENHGLSFIDRVVHCPSIFLWLPYDGLLIAGAWIGVLLSVMIVAGFHSRVCFLFVFLLYLSYVSIGQVLFSFQWDSLILETTFLAILLPSSGKFFKNRIRGADMLVSWLFLWLLFRLYIESGLAKLFWGPESWATLEAMSHYYETAPIPTPLGWAAHCFQSSPGLRPPKKFS